MRVTVGAVLFNEDATKVLLVHRKDNNRWALIGGGIEKGECPVDAVLREVKEETGISKIEGLRRVTFFESEGLIVLAFTGVVSGKIVNMEPDKHYDVQWHHVWKLPNPWCGLKVIRAAQGALLNV